jgi:hypothetical protein
MNLPLLLNTKNYVVIEVKEEENSEATTIRIMPRYKEPCPINIGDRIFFLTEIDKAVKDDN